MSMREVWICDDDRCDVKVEIDQGDGPPDGWVTNVDGDDFCPECGLRLDPPEEDDGTPAVEELRTLPF